MTDPPQSDPILHRIHASGLIALTIAAAAMLALSLFLSSRSAPPAVLWMDLRTVSGDQLIWHGITLLPPPPGAEAQVVPQSVAEQVAGDQWRGAAIREIALARLIELGRVPPVERLAWIVSVDPAAVGVPTHGGAPTGPVSIPSHGYTFVNGFALVFVDAQTGSFVSATVVSHIVDP